MSFEHLPERARNSALIQTLDSKLQEPTQTDFDYRGQLVALATQVTADVSYINQLFPEYTPHDALYHLNRLFHVADLVIERQRFEAQNAAELFVLAASLYAHDWGMAVSEKERVAIGGIIAGELPAIDLAILPDERERLLRYASSIGREARVVVDCLADWRNYVRETHPERSAVRARAFFEKQGGGVGDAVARVARGHGVDIAELDKPNEFPTDFSINGLNANLRALAVYVRLVDLLDIADDRTPYAIWKFVSPQDPKSTKEWAKHRALNPVTCPTYQNGRMILVDGSTSDPDVWAALRDLERYVKRQNRECNDVLARMGDTRFHLDLPIVEWRVATPGFTPVDLRFEFQRESMFRILSDEIYEGDVYVFLRELLQNSIDAIRLRRQLLARQDIAIAGIVHFQVDQLDKGFATVRCRDNGIGMDEHIVRNYLALAGRSYYSSDEFRHLGLEIDAIARFGIGILSCFIAGESIEIDTRRDPILTTKNAALHIEIPSVERQFRVYPAGERFKTGTTVTVHVSGDRLQAAPEGWNTQLRVADYLGEVGAFSEFPVLVSEGPSHVLILNASADEAAMRQLVVRTLGFSPEADSFRVQRAAQEFPWTSIFAPQDEGKAKTAFKVRWFDVQDDLKLGQYEGRIACLLPFDENACGFSAHLEDYKGTSLRTDGENYDFIRWVDSRWSRGQVARKPTSITITSSDLTYYNGILVVGTGIVGDYYENFLPEPTVWINFPRTKNIQLNVARLGTRQDVPAWRKIVFSALSRRILEEEREGLNSLAPLARAHRIGQLIAWYNLKPEDIAEVLPEEKWPLIWLDRDLRATVLNLSDSPEDPWPSVPGVLANAADQELLRVFYNWPLNQNDVETKWSGQSAVLESGAGYAADYITKAVRFGGWVIGKKRPIKRIRFLRGPRSYRDLLPQSLFYPLSEIPRWRGKELREQAVANPDVLTNEDWCLLVRDTQDISWPYATQVGWFLPPNENCFACGRSAWNVAHPIVQLRLRYALALKEAKEKRKLPPADLGRLGDDFDVLTHRAFASEHYSEEKFQGAVNSCAQAFSEADLVPFPRSVPTLKMDMFVLGSISAETHRLVTPNDRTVQAKNSFGEPI